MTPDNGMERCCSLRSAAGWGRAPVGRLAADTWATRAWPCFHACARLISGTNSRISSGYHMPHPRGRSERIDEEMVWVRQAAGPEAEGAEDVGCAVVH